MFNYNNLYYRNYPNTFYKNNINMNNSTTSTNCNKNDNITNKSFCNSERSVDQISNQESNVESKPGTEKENGFRIGPLTIFNDEIDVLGFSFAIDDLIIIGLILIIFLDSDSDFVLIIILGLMLFNVSLSSLNLF